MADSRPCFLAADGKIFFADDIRAANDTSSIEFVRVKTRPLAWVFDLWLGICFVPGEPDAPASRQNPLLLP